MHVLNFCVGFNGSEVLHTRSNCSLHNWPRYDKCNQHEPYECVYEVSVPSKDNYTIHTHQKKTLSWTKFFISSYLANFRPPAVIARTARWLIESINKAGPALKCFLHDDSLCISCISVSYQRCIFRSSSVACTSHFYRLVNIFFLGLHVILLVLSDFHAQ